MREEEVAASAMTPWSALDILDMDSAGFCFVYLLV